MICPNCNHPRLNTVEVYQDVARTIRYKKCGGCLWRFTSVETIPDESPVIPNKVRKPRKRAAPH